MTNKPQISASEPDWSREKRTRWWDPGRQLLQCIRRYQRWHAKGGPLAALMCRYYSYRHIFWSTVSGADIPLRTQIGGGLLIPHPNGIVIHPDAVIGPNCLIFQQSTIGAARKRGLPVIGGDVHLGAGAKVLGGIHVGDHARIGANAVVLRDVPSGVLAAGVPARFVTPEQRTVYAENEPDTPTDV